MREAVLSQMAGVWASVQAAWETLFPPPPTPADALREKCKQLETVKRELDRRTRTARREQQRMTRLMRVHMAEGRLPEARQVARRIATSERADRARLATQRQIDGLVLQLQEAHDSMVRQQAFVEATRLVARFNRAVPAALIHRAAIVYGTERETMSMKNEEISEVLDETMDDLAEEADADGDADDPLAREIFKRAAEADGLQLGEEMPTIVVAAAPSDGAEAEVAVDDALRLRLVELKNTGEGML